MPNRITKVGVLALLAVLATVNAHAAVDTALSGLVTDMTTYWGTIQTLVLAVVIFGIGIAFAKRLKSR